MKRKDLAIYAMPLLYKRCKLVNSDKHSFYLPILTGTIGINMLLLFCY